MPQHRLLLTLAPSARILSPHIPQLISKLNLDSSSYTRVHFVSIGMADIAIRNNIRHNIDCVHNEYNESWGTPNNYIPS